MKLFEKSDVAGKSVLLRVDYNFPLITDNGREICTDWSRAEASLDSIYNLLKYGAKRIFICSHIGRPKNGKGKGFGCVFTSFKTFMIKKINNKGEFILNDSDISCFEYYERDNLRVIDHNIAKYVESLKYFARNSDTEIILMENIRLFYGEIENDADFSRDLASVADVYINDAFSVSHRKHSSVYGVVDHFSNNGFVGHHFFKEFKMLGLLNMIKEGESIICDDNASIFDFEGLCIIGGSKLDTKIPVLKNIIVTMKAIFIGGKLSHPFLYAKGYNIGKSLDEDTKEQVNNAREIMEFAQERGCEIILPIDAKITDEFPSAVDGNYAIYCKDIENIDMNDGFLLDIGPKTIDLVCSYIAQANFVLWNGPMGLYEFSEFNEGSKYLADFLYKRNQGECIFKLKYSDLYQKSFNCFSLIGGGDTLSAISNAMDDLYPGEDVKSMFSYISTSGGAAMEMLSGKKLPGVSKIMNR